MFPSRSWSTCSDPIEKLEDGPTSSRSGGIFRIKSRDDPGTRDLVGTTHKDPPTDLKVSDPLLIDDGRVLVRVAET